MIDILIGVNNELVIGSIIFIVIGLVVFGLVMGKIHPDNQEERLRDERDKAKQMLKHAEKLEQRAQRLAEKTIEDALVQQRAEQILREKMQARDEEDEDS